MKFILSSISALIFFLASGQGQGLKNAQKISDSLYTFNSAADVFKGVSPRMERNNIITNVYNEFTGEPCSYKRVYKFANGKPLTNADADGIIVRKLGVNFYKLTKQYITAQDFGAIGDGLVDDYKALQSAINTCSAWGLTLHITAGTYNHSHTLDIPMTYIIDPTNISSTQNGNPWSSPKIVGDGSMQTYLVYTGKDSGNCVQAIGGVGNFGGGGLYDLTVAGNGKTKGFFINGRGWIGAWNCRFQNHNICIDLVNNAAQHFTEDVVMHNCVYGGFNTLLFYDQQPGGDPSFNGSGIDGGYANIDKSGAIKIHGFPYNSPLSLTAWLHNDRKNTPIYFIENGVGSVANFYGNLRFENFYNLPDDSTILNPKYANALENSNGATVTYCGTLNTLGYMYSNGFTQTDAYMVRGDNGLPVLSNPHAVTLHQTISNGAAVIDKMSTEVDYDRGYFAFITFKAKGYDARYLYFINSVGQPQWGNAGIAKNLQTIYFNATNGWQEPQINLNKGGYLEIYGNKTDGKRWDANVQFTMHIIPMTESTRDHTKTKY